jgi:hypothetical protein
LFSRSVKTAKPEGATNTNGPLTTSDINSIEVAMRDITTAPQRSKFLFLFIIGNKKTTGAMRTLIRAEANHERLARKEIHRTLAPGVSVQLAAKIRLSDVPYLVTHNYGDNTLLTLVSRTCTGEDRQ